MKNIIICILLNVLWYLLTPGQWNVHSSWETVFAVVMLGILSGCCVNIMEAGLKRWLNKHSD